MAFSTGFCICERGRQILQKYPEKPGEFALVFGDEESVYWLDFSVPMKAYKTKQGDTFAPVFSAWLDGQERPAVVSEGTEITISAKTALNTAVHFDSNSKPDVYDFSQQKDALNAEAGETYGELTGLAVTLELYSEHAGLKGVQLPEGEVSFDIALTV